MSDHLDAVNSGADLRWIIAAKTALREEITSQLRGEFTVTVEAVRAAAEARCQAIERDLIRAVGANKEIIETRMDAADQAKESLARELDRRYEFLVVRLDALRKVMEDADETIDNRALANNLASDKQLAAAIDTNSRAISVHNAAIRAEISEVDKRSSMRFDNNEQRIKSTEDHLMSRLASVKDLIDQRAAMNAEAISKAETATTLRFASVNEFRQTLTDQAASFVSRATLEATQAQTQATINALDNQVQAYGSVQRENIAQMRSELAGLKSTVMVGGSTIVVVLLVIQLAVNIFGSPHSGAAQTAAVNSATDTQRVSDLINSVNAQNNQISARLDALSARLNLITPPSPTR